MKHRNYWFISFLIALSMLLSACAGSATPTVEIQPTNTTAPTTAPTDVVEPTDVPLQPATEAELDSAFSAFLSQMEGYNVLKMDDFSTMLAEEPKPFLLDVREMSEATEKGHIESAVLIPLRELDDNLDKLPSFDTTIVNYCGSGWRCTISMTYLETLGWENVLALKDNSYTGWVEAGYATVSGAPADAPVLNAAQPDPALALSFAGALNAIPEGFGGIAADQLFTALAENKDLILIDVRTPAEIEKAGYIEAPNALSIPLEDFVKMRSDWPSQDATIAIYCGSGHRSTIAMSIFWAYGYTNVSSLKGGFTAWKTASLPTVGGQPQGPDLDTAFSTFLAGMEKYDTVSLDELNVALAEDANLFLLDVREVSEATEKGHIEGAVLIPLRELADNLDKLPSFDTPVVTYCASGWRCTIALPALEALGWQNVKALKGNSFTGWVEAGYPTVAGAPAEAPAMNAADPDPAMVAAMDAMLSAVPEGFGGIAVDSLSAELLEDPDLILIDVRTEAERKEKGIIDAENQVSIPLEDIIKMKADWPADKAAKIVIYCGSGHRSTIAMSILWSYGYTDVRSMKGGFTAWVDGGFPTAALP